MSFQYRDKVNNEDTYETEVCVFKDSEYKFSFYDGNIGTIRTVTGMVDDIFDTVIVLMVSKFEEDQVTCESCKVCECPCQGNKETIPLIDCRYNQYKHRHDKYKGPDIVQIPITNILNAEYSTSICDETKNDAGGFYTMIIGISAEVVKSIVVNLSFFSDKQEEAFKYVELRAGNVYDIVFEENGTIFETRAKVERIVPEDKKKLTPNDSFIREYVAADDEVYSHKCPCKDDFMKSLPPEAIKIIVDISQEFNGRYEVISLDKIRDCKLIEDNEIKPPHDHCHCHNKPNGEQHCHQPKKIKLDDDNTAIVDNKGVIVNPNTDKEIRIPFPELIKFYIGLQ